MKFKLKPKQPKPLKIKLKPKEPFRQELTRECDADGCQETIPARMLMCPKHWAMVSKETQAAVWCHYTTGQELGTVRPTYSYLHARANAILEVAHKEGKTLLRKSCPLSCGGFLIPTDDKYKCSNCTYERPNFVAPTKQQSEIINNREYTSESQMPFGRYGPQGGDPRIIGDLPTDYLEWMLTNLEGKRNPGLVQALEDEYRKRPDAKTA